MTIFASIKTVLLTSAALALPTGLHAQTVPNPATANSADADPARPGTEAQTAAGDIVVTAQKRSERLQDVPVQVDVLTAKSIEAQQIKQTADIVATIPNLTIEKTDTYTNSVIVLRGISQASNADTPVAVIVDGVPQDDPKQFNMHLFDIAQIEVLKGPQGSLYGRNAEAGAIIITTAAPSNDLRGFADLSYGNGQTFDGSGGISGAIVPDKVQFRLSGSFFHTDGLIFNTFRRVNNDRVPHDWSLRGNLYFNLAEGTRLQLIAQHEDFNAAGVYFVPVFSGSANDFQKPQSNFPNRGSGTSTNLTAKLEQELGFATLTSISGHTKLDQIQTTDVDFTNPVTVPGFSLGDNQPFNNRIFSQELRLTSNKGPFRWLVSGDYLHANQFISTNIFVDTGHPATDPTNPALIILSNPAQNKRSNYGISAQADYDIGALTLTAGGRYDSDHRTQDNLLNGSERRATFSKFQPKVTATYKLDAEKLVYATYGVGFRSGGFNPPSFRVPLYYAEVLTNYEVGFKTQWLDRKLTVNGALFRSDIRNYQFSYIDFGSGSEVTGNIDRVRLNGAELEVRVNPLSGFNLFGNLGYAKPKDRRFAAFPQYVGNETPRANNITLNGGFDYTVPVSATTSLFLRANAQHYSSKYWFIDNLDVQRPKTYVNGSLGLTRGGITATFWAKNIFNTKAYETYFPSQSTGAPFDVAFPNRPATYGGEVSFKF
ncbi:TonB-dependent receptor [Sphingomonas bacterium]|uniref:TonB-dependent receptor n=1 Tax=Sphingomonas bacterium TaxID=1895847 RepID=UPI001576E894|nr:TonB-dependent receptor [Sphingomonas bacterium]